MVSTLSSPSGSPPRSRRPANRKRFSSTPRSAPAGIERAGPFGQGSPEPVFVFPAHRLTDAVEIGSGGHVRVKLKGGDGASVGGVAFRCAQEPLGRALLAARGESVHLAATLSLNRWGGRETAELRVLDLAKPV